MIDAEALQTLAVGSVIAETYQVTGLLGRGGMGSVWEASHLRLPGKRVAIKVLHADVSSDQEALARFRREAEIATRLGHPNIVEVHDFNLLPGGRPYLVLELLVGESLDARMRRGFIPPDQVLRIAGQVAGALTAAHRAGVVHRDLKPQNVFLVPREEEVGGDLVKVLDFGISKIRGSQTVRTQDSTILGTPQYMAPEQATGNHAAVDPRTDVFALGAIVYEMLAGRPAFSGQSIPEVVYKVVYVQPPPLAQIAPGLPQRTLYAVDRALAKLQDDRFPDVASFIEQLAGVSISTLRRQPVTSPPEVADPLAATIDSGQRDRTPLPPPPDATTFKTRRPLRRGVWIIIALAVLAAAAVTAIVIANQQQAEEVATPAPPPVDPPETDLRKLAAQAIGEEILAEQAAAGDDEGDDDGEDDAHDHHDHGEHGEAAEEESEDAVAAPAKPPVAKKPSSGASKKKPTVPGVHALSPDGETDGQQAEGSDVRSDLVAAESALRSGDYREALHLAERAEREGGGAMALAVMARTHCAMENVGSAAAALRRIPRRKLVLRRAVRSFCATRGQHLDDE